ncbi:MAG: hypothetical protein ACTHMM_13755 [Agriterribacter sp.]
MKKRKHQYLQTSLLYREKIKNPYEIISDFFCAADLAAHRKYIKQLLQAAQSNKSWNKGAAGDFLNRFRLLESVINAAYLINQVKKKSLTSLGNDDPFNKRYFSNGNGTDWDCFPRSLSMKEYIDPYLVFKRFFKYLELSGWKEELKYLLDYALLNMSLSEAGVDIDILAVYIHLTKLTEAAHLISVREITNLGG